MFTAALAAVASTATATIPTYTTFELQARSNIVDGYNLPSNSSFNSGTPAINDAGTMAFRLIVVGTTGRLRRAPRPVARGSVDQRRR